MFRLSVQISFFCRGELNLIFRLTGHIIITSDQIRSVCSFWQYSFHIGCYSHDVASGSRSSLLKQTKMEDNEMDLLIYHIAVWSYGMCFIKIMRPCQILRSLRALLDFLHQQTSMFSACIMEKWTLYYLSYLFIASSVWTVIYQHSCNFYVTRLTCSAFAFLCWRESLVERCW